MQTLPKCAYCGVNFKLSETGWFARATDLRENARRNDHLPWAVPFRIEELDAMKLRELLGRRDEEIGQLRVKIGAMESTLGWKMLWTFRELRNAVLPLPLYLKVRGLFFRDKQKT